MLIDSSSNEMPNAELTTQHQILTFLQSASLIGDHRTHSAYEKQGLQFVNDNIGPSIEAIYHSLRPLYQFYLTPKNFKSAHMIVEANVFLRSYL